MALNVIQRVAIYLGLLWAALAVVVVRFLFGRPWSWALAGVVVVELLWLLYGYSIRWIGNSGIRAIPGPAPALFSGHWPRVVNDYGPLYREAWHSHGSAKAGGHGVFKLFFGRTPRVIVGDLDLITRVANGDFLNFDGRPGALYRARQISMLLQIRGPLWHRIRSAMLPAFSYQNMKGIHPHLITATGRMRDDIKRFKAEDKIDLMTMWASMTVEAIGLLAFGTDLRQNNAKPPGLVETTADGKAEVVNEHPLVNATKRVLPLLRFAINDTAVVMSAFPFLRPVMMGLFGKQILKKSVETWEHLDAQTGAIVAKRRADPRWEQQNDLLTRILEAKDTDGKALTDYEVLDQVNTFLIAGYETMASTLGYTSLLLAQNPDKEAALVAEIDRLYEQYGTEPDLDALTEYEYAEAVLKESMRLYTPAIMTRTPTPAGDAKIAPKGSGVVYPLPPGLVMHMGSAIVHYDEKHFPDPTAFRPERWLADDPENVKRDKHAWMAFGFGPRGCIGLRLAMTECKLALVQVYRHFTFRIHRDTQLPPQLVAGVTHVPKTPLFATVQPRAR